MPNDGMDDILSNMAVNQMETEQTTRRKRQASEEREFSLTNKRVCSVNEVLEQLSIIDDSKTLAVFDVIDHYNSDLIVK